MLEKYQTIWKKVRWPLLGLVLAAWFAGLVIEFAFFIELPKPLSQVIAMPIIFLWILITMPAWTVAGCGIFIGLIVLACFLSAFLSRKFLPWESRGLVLLTPVLCSMVGLSSWYLISRYYTAYYTGVIQWISIFWICFVPALIGLWAGKLSSKNKIIKSL